MFIISKFNIKKNKNKRRRQWKDSRRSSEDNPENLVLIIVGNGHDLGAGFPVLVKNGLRLALLNLLFGNLIESKPLRKIMASIDI